MITGVVTIHGPQGTAKSSLALTFPPEIAYYDLEYGGERAWGWSDAVDSGAVIRRTVDIPVKSLTSRQVQLNGYLDAWRDFVQQFEEDCVNNSVQCVVLDTGTLVWAMDRDAYLEEVQKSGNPNRKQLLQIEYGEPNRRMESLYAMAKSTRTGLIMIHHETDEYQGAVGPDGRPIMDEQNRQVSYTTGNKVPDGFRHGRDLSDWVIRMRLQEHDGKHHAVGTILKNPYSFALLGRDVWDISYEVLEQEVKAKTGRS